MIRLKKAGKNRRLVLILIDIFIIIFSYYFIECFIRDTFFLANYILSKVIRTICSAIAIYQLLFMFANVYDNITRYEGGRDYLVYAILCIVASAIISIISIILGLGLLSFKHNLVIGLIIAMLMIAYRVVIRMLLNYDVSVKNNIEKPKKLLLIGAGQATRDIIKSIKYTMRDKYDIVGIIDDSDAKIGYSISGIKVLGDRNKIIEICEKENVEEIFFSISRIAGKDRRDILMLCQQTKAKVKVLPSVDDIIRNKKIIDNLKNVEIDDILGRDPIKLDNENISELITDKVVLVTGGGGSIGSELCRQISKYKPKRLVIFDIYENNAYDIQMELQRKYPEINVETIIGSVRDVKKIESVFEIYRPYVVFHAAAHKHVPLMEVSPLEAIKNNVFGTYNVVNASDKYGVKKFVLISTDKAVNPTNVMGATKRMCEMIIQAKDKVSNTEYAAVRFGNVLGSNGSVVPLFKEQIAEGGPVTVTHKDIIRYFMTIEEATQLVLQAATYAAGGEIFILDMGEPVKIYDLAVSMIKLSGYEPNVDMKIKITGLRPGEKLYEELLMGEEGLEKTEHEKIFIGEPLDISMEDIDEKIEMLTKLVSSEYRSKEEIKTIMHIVVPTFIEPEKVNKKREVVEAKV